MKYDSFNSLLKKNKSDFAAIHHHFDCGTCKLIVEKIENKEYEFDNIVLIDSVPNNIFKKGSEKIPFYSTIENGKLINSHAFREHQNPVELHPDGSQTIVHIVE